jgi:hypothetical protein
MIENKKYFVKYTTLIPVVAVFVISTIALGLLVSLVNPPTCEKSKNVVKRELGKLDPIASNDKFEYLKYLIYKKGNVAHKLDRCEELSVSTNGTLWEGYRLPEDIIPINYDVLIYTPKFSYELYSGEIEIEIDIKKSTDLIMLNAKYLGVNNPILKDSSGNEIELKCDGLFLPNSYYIVKTFNKLAANRRYFLKLFFTGFLNVFNSGLFEVKYKERQNEFDGSMLISHFEPTDAQKA